MYQTDLKLSDFSSAFNPVQAAELALRGAEQIYDINVSAARVLLRAQASTAAAFGLPDWSALFDLATDQTRHMLSAGTDQVLGVAQRASDVAAEFQRNAGQLIEAQTAQATEHLQRGMQEFNAQTVQTLSRPDLPFSAVSEAAHALN